MKPIKFYDGFVTNVPTCCLIEDYQMLRAAMQIQDENERNSRINTILECIAESIERYTMASVHDKISIIPSPSSIIAMGIDNGILCHDDGSDLLCAAGKPVSHALRGGVCQCENCPHAHDCHPENGLLLMENNILYEFNNLTSAEDVYVSCSAT